jgi:hypothetical protein
VPRPPPSQRLCEAACLAFALWTLCAHAVVAAGGSLRALLALFLASALAALALGLGHRLRRAPAPRPEAPPPAPLAPGPRGRHPRALLAAGGAALGLAGTLAFAATGSAILLWALAVGILGAAALPFLLGEAPAGEAAARGRGREAALFALALLCALVALATHRPDDDDAFYVNVAVAASEAPGAPLLAFDTLLGVPGLPLLLPVYRLHSWELLQAALSLASGLPPIACFHWISAALMAFLLPLAHAQLLRLLLPRRWLEGVAILVFLLLAVGGVSHWWGNLALVRIWQGKAVYLFVFLPLVEAHALAFARRPQARRFALLAAAQVAALGASATAVWGAPLGAAVGLAAATPPTLRGARRFAGGALASSYLLGAGLLLARALRAGGQVPSLEQPGLPGQRLAEALGLFLGDGRLAAFGAFAWLAGWACAPPGLGRRFAIAAPLGASLLLLDPFTEDWVRAHVTGGSYWRALWSLPLPLLATFVLMAPLRLPAGGPGARRVLPGLACGLGLVLFAWLVPPMSALHPGNGHPESYRVRLGWPRLKVPEPAYGWARALHESVPPGERVLAPEEISTWLATFPRPTHPVVVRSLYLAAQSARLGEEEAALRAFLARYAAGADEGPKAAALFRAGLAELGVGGVCLRSSPRAGEARRILRAAGFERRLGSIDYEIWTRAGIPGRGAHPPGTLPGG